MADQSVEPLWARLWASRFQPNTPRLRFELGGEQFGNETPVPRFLQAHQRASTVADALFGEGCVAIVASSGWIPESDGLTERALDGFAALQETGFIAPQRNEWRAPLYPDPEGEEDAWALRSYDLGCGKVLRDTLLWHAVASEMPICPSAPILTFLMDAERSLMLHVYDDRGMDVIA